MAWWLPFGLTPRRWREEGVRYGDIYTRALASAIDLFLLFLLLNPMFGYVWATMYRHVDSVLLHQVRNDAGFTTTIRLIWQSHLGPLWLLNAAFQILVLGIVYICVQVVWGKTPGKWLFGLRVARAVDHEPLGAGRYILRFLATILAMAPLMLGIFWASFNRERRGWHDFIAGTVVLNIRPQGWYWGQVKRLYRWLKARGQPASPPLE